MKKRFAIRQVLMAVLLVSAAGFFQNSNLLNFLNIKPNLSLVVLITLTFFFSDFRYYLIPVFLAGVFLRFQPGLEAETIIFTALVLLAFLVREKLPGKIFFANIFLIAAATLIFSLVSNFSFFTRETITILGEMIYNVILGMFIFLFLKRVLNHAQGFRATF